MHTHKPGVCLSGEALPVEAGPGGPKREMSSPTTQSRGASGRQFATEFKGWMLGKGAASRGNSRHSDAAQYTSSVILHTK
jgi:hypothetical protein